MGIAPAQLEEESLIREKIAELKLPDGVKFKRLEPMTESTGEPALRIYFAVSRRRPTTPKYIKELNSMTHEIQQSAFSLSLGKFLFFKFEDAR